MSTVLDIVRMVQDRRLTAADSASILSEHMSLLADSITQFAVTNSALRCMLRDRHDHELNALRLSEQRDALLSKLARTQDTCQVLALIYLSQCCEGYFKSSNTAIIEQMQIFLSCLFTKANSAFHPPGSVNEYQLRLGRQRQVWFIPLADERGVCR